ncbi:MAG: hypothetical protein ABFC96_18560 [Thermoguttaceae bacterium]
MSLLRPSRRIRRSLILTAVCVAASLAIVVDARGVVLYSSPDRNLSAPSASEGLAAWNLEATWGDFLATPIDSTHFIAAKHVGLQSSSVVLGGVTYPVNTSVSWSDPGSDLRIWSLESGYTFPKYATLYNAAVDGSEVGKTLTVIGRGTQRGSAVSLNGDQRGWYWGASDGKQSWGQNVVDGFDSYNSVSSTSLLTFAFTTDGLHNSTLSVGDSSGGVFIFSQGEWKLAGINWAVTGPFSYTGTGTSSSGFNASLYDLQGLYLWDEAHSTWVYDPNHEPGASYASRISDRLAWIQSVAPDAAVPEPAALVLLACGAIALVIGRVARRR